MTSSSTTHAQPSLTVALLCLIVIQTLVALDVSVAKASDESKAPRRVLVPIEMLPEQFTDEKLPRKFDKTDRCYNLIGCFEKVPITVVPQDPASLKTEFRLYSREQENATVVAFERVQNCLMNSVEDCDIYPYDLSLLLNSPFRASRRTIILVGGYFSKAPSGWELRMKDLWLKLEDVNVIIVSWIGGNSGIYQTAAVNTRPVARQLTVLLYYIAKLNGLELTDDSVTEKIHIVGHSLGAHIAGFTGTDLAGKVGRISGLEPAGPNFDSLDTRFRLDKSDAQLVDALHTNGGASIFLDSRFGSALTSGHIDLYANDGLHQPGCRSDRLGCSHKKANNYYEAFLKHELAMREYLTKSRPTYRLYAYASDSFEEFHNGSGLIKYCPTTTLDEEEPYSADLYKCSVPIDYISWFDVLKKELQDSHGVDFDPSATNQGKKYYFYTNEYSDDQTDHFLLKIRANKKATTTKPLGCDLVLNVEMSNRLSNEYKVKKYKLVDDEGEYEIVVPFLSPNLITKYEIAKLDENQYYLPKLADSDSDDDDQNNSRASLQKSIARILPSSITIAGININNKNDKKSMGNKVASFFKSIVNMAKGEDASESKPEEYCDLGVDSLTVEPLRRFHRRLLAIYTADAMDKAAPDIVVMNSEQDKSIKDLMPSFTLKPVDPIYSRLYLHTVIIGPNDDSINYSPDEILDSTEAESNLTSTTVAYSGGASNISANTWLTLTISMVIVVIVMALIATLTTNKFDDVGKRPILTDLQLD